MLCLVGDCGNIVIFAIFAKFASIANFYGPLIALCFNLLAIVAILSFLPYLLSSPVSPTFMCPSLLCALPCWRFWQNCHFHHICQILHYVLFFAIFVVACISGHISVTRLEKANSCWLQDSDGKWLFYGF